MPRSHPGWTPELTATVARLEAEREKGPPRERVGWTPCLCGRRAITYKGDVRARGWLRFECKYCGRWGDKDPTFKPSAAIRALLRKTKKHAR